MKKINNIKNLEDLGRIRFSKNYYAREFLYSEIANFYQIANYPENIELFINVGEKFCNNILEPLKEKFNHISIRSAYRSKSVNDFGNKNNLNCASNQSNYAGHIWDERDGDGNIGGTVCIFIPSFNDRFADNWDWLRLGFWIAKNIEYSDMTFFSSMLNTFNISWHEKPKKDMNSYREPKGNIIKNNEINPKNLSTILEHFKLQEIDELYQKI
jgi:hypothetical protein